MPEYIIESGYSSERIIHLFIHSLLHILGYTHDSDDDFNEMSQVEINILNQMNIENPYDS